MMIMRELDIPSTAQRIMEFLKTTASGAGFSRVVVAVSGGIDSATAITLATRALGPESVYAISLPYQDWHTAALERTQRLLDHLEIPSAQIREIGIAPMVQAHTQAMNLESFGSDLGRVRLGNIMARIRMIALFDYAKQLSAIVLGTENKSEHYLGYYTRFGDEASDIEPLRNLYKTEVYQLAEYLGVPQEIREAVPTAGLWPEQTDEGQFGFTYRTADEVLYGLYEAGLSPQALLERGLDKTAIDQVQAWVTQMEFKHHLPRIAPEPVSG
jgi:NAD+ synthase